MNIGIRLHAVRSAIGLLAVVAGLSACAADGPEPVIDASGYPSVYTPLVAATTQMSNEEAAGNEARLTALSAARKSGAVSEAEYQRRIVELRALAANHGSDMQGQITK